MLDRTRVHAGAAIIPVAIDSEDLAQTVHTVAPFPESVAGGVAAAQQLAVKLRAGGLNAFFDQRKFGRVHPEVVAEPYLVSRSWCAGWLAGAYTQAGTQGWPGSFVCLGCLGRVKEVSSPPTITIVGSKELPLMRWCRLGSSWPLQLPVRPTVPWRSLPTLSLFAAVMCRPTASAIPSRHCQEATQPA